MPDVMIGVIPSSIRVPRLLASIMRNQYSGSDVSDETMPYSGIWLMTRKIISVNCGFCLVSGGQCDVFGCPYSRPHELLVEDDLGVGRRHLREVGRERMDEIEEAYCTTVVSSVYSTAAGAERRENPHLDDMIADWGFVA